MYRSTLAAAVAGLTLVLAVPGSGIAATPKPSAASLLAHSARVALQHHGSSVSIRRSETDPLHLAPRQRLAAPAQQTAASLRLDPSAFSPMTVDIDQVADNPSVDQAYFADNHSTAYENLRRVTGYYERANGLYGLSARYQGSVFASAADAAHAYTDGVTHGQLNFQNTKVVDCSNVANTPCSDLAYTLPTNPTSIEYYSEIQVNQCLAEMTLTEPVQQYQQTGQDQAFANQLAQIQVAAYNRLNAACGSASTTTNPPTSAPPTSAPPTSAPPTTTPVPPTATPQPSPTATHPAPSIRIQQVLIVHTVKGKSTSTKTLKSKEQGLFVAIYQATNANGTKPTGSVSFTSGKKSTKPDKMTAATLDDGTTFFGINERFQVGKKAVKLVAHFKVTLGSASATKTLKFTVKP